MRTLSAFRTSAGLVTLTLILCAFVIAFNVQPSQANPKYAGIVVDAKTGKTLYAYKADSLRYPASLTKMMTMYMMFEALESGQLSKKTRIRMSKNAASRPPSKLGIKPGRSIAAEHAILALATKSANDVAAAVAEHLGGSEANFARMMTKKARQLGMKNTTFKNASGLTAKGQLSTARDMARLGIALREHFPQHYRYFSTRNFKYGKANYRNHNRLLGRVKGVDGIKTGYTRASGFNLVSSVEANRRSIVAVVMGGRSGKSRNAQMQKLISKYLRKASRGSKKQLIASRTSTSFALASSGYARLPKSGPVPQFRETSVAKQVVPTSKPVTVAALVATQQTRSAPATKIEQATIAERMKQEPVVPTVRPAKPVGVVDPVTTAATPSVEPSGWVVQVGASDSRNGALSLLERARKKAPGIVGKRKTYTETVEKGGATLHRARFWGFSSKNEARSACKALKRKRIKCLAVSS